MEDFTFNSSYYGAVTIRTTNKIWKNLEDSTCEKLAALVNGAEEKLHLSKKSRGNPGDGVEGYVHNYGDNQIASVKDVGDPPNTVTVMNMGKVKANVHVWD